MLEKFWESIGSDLGKQWLERLFSPAFLFWLGGAGAWLLAGGAANWHSRWDTAWTWVNGLQPLLQGALLIGALILVVLSSLLIETLRFFLLRLLEGYWPWPLRRLSVWVAQLRGWFTRRDEAAYQLLKLKEKKTKLDVFEQRELARLEATLNYVPPDPDDWMAFSLGDILRSGEGASYRKYGLDAVVCWPRLWLLLPETARADLSAARQSLEQRIELWGWGFLFLGWSFWTLWALPVALLWLALAYTLSKQAAMGYADLIEAAFDIYRWDLYKAARLPIPALAAQEREMGLKLTAYLWRGEPEGISFRHPAG